MPIACRLPELSSIRGSVHDCKKDAMLECGCQRCSAVDLTLKDGVEKTLMGRIPQLRGVCDKTDHTVRENAYFK